MHFFEIRTPRDMLNKAKRELARLQSEFNIDNVFNFFVTAYHVQDYVRNTAPALRDALKRFLDDPDLKACRDLCDKGKHLTLTKRADPDTDMVGSNYSDAAYSELGYWEDEVWTLVYDDNAVEVRPLAGRVIDKWNRSLPTMAYEPIAI
jgi:hypothetical protein